MYSIFHGAAHLAAAQAVPLAAAIPVVSCSAPADLLNANRTAMLAGPAPVGTLTTRYAYSGQGLTGEILNNFDLTSGFFVESDVIGSRSLSTPVVMTSSPHQRHRRSN